MKVLVCFLVFLVSSFVEVRVKASSPKSKTVPPLQKPENCYLSTIQDCLFSSGKRVVRLQENKIVLNLKEETTIERILLNTTEKYSFLNGTLWVQNFKPIQVSTLYGDIKSDEGEFWIIENSNKIIIRSIIGLTKVNINSNTLEIPEGFQVWISGKDKQGKNTYGVPEVIPIENHLKSWSELFAGTREEFRNKVSILKDLYKDNHNESGEFYQRIADRHVASIEAKKRADKISAQKRKAYLQEIRKLYFERVFER